MQAAIEGSGERIDLLASPSTEQPSGAAAAATATSTPSPAANTGAAPSAPPATATPAVTAPTGAGSLVTGDTNITGVMAEVTQCDRKDGVLSIKVRFRNSSSAKARVPIIGGRNYESYYVGAQSKKYFILKDSEGTYLTPRADGFGDLFVDLDPAGQYTWWAKFPAPPADVKTVTLYTPLAAPLENIPVSDK